VLRETPLAHLWGIVLMSTVGWMPGYLVFNAAGESVMRIDEALRKTEAPMCLRCDSFYYSLCAMVIT
jgi:hypothetical protein